MLALETAAKINNIITYSKPLYITICSRISINNDDDGGNGDDDDGDDGDDDDGDDGDHIMDYTHIIIILY